MNTQPHVQLRACMIWSELLHLQLCSVQCVHLSGEHVSPKLVSSASISCQIGRQMCVAVVTVFNYLYLWLFTLLAASPGKSSQGHHSSKRKNNPSPTRISIWNVFKTRTHDNVASSHFHCFSGFAIDPDTTTKERPSETQREMQTTTMIYDGGRTTLGEMLLPPSVINKWRICAGNLTTLKAFAGMPAAQTGRAGRQEVGNCQHKRSCRWYESMFVSIILY